MNKLISLVLVVMMFFAACTTPDSDTELVGREGLHIVFIMGEDKVGSDYYTLADEYYAGQTSVDHMVKHCRSLGEVITYLNGLDGHAIDTVDIVVHGNKATGLSTQVSDGGYKATPKRLIQEMILHRAPDLQPGVVDAETVINIWSCGVGGNQMTVMGLRHLFKPLAGPVPNVITTKDFVVYKRNQIGEVKRYAATYYPYQYRRGYRPSDSEIALDLRRRFPDVKVDWLATVADPYAQIEYHLPVTFIEYYDRPRDRPDLTTTQQQDYVKSHDQISEQLEDLDMHYDDFTWQVDKRIITDDAGQRRYAVKVIGMTTILCYLEVEE
jgi:hypothetical protein